MLRFQLLLIFPQQNNKIKISLTICIWDPSWLNKNISVADVPILTQFKNVNLL